MDGDDILQRMTTLPPVNRTGLLRRAALWLGDRRGWSRYGMAALLGGLATLALPPAGVVPVLLIAFPGLLWLLDGGATRRGAFFLGWWFGFAHLVLGLYWISFALLTDIERFWWMMPFAMAGLPALLAVFPGLATLVLFRLPLRGGIARAVAFAVIWTALEWVRGHVLTGFPWNLIGYAWVDVAPVLQVTAVTGVYGLSLLTVLVASLPAALADPALRRGRASAALALGLALFIGIHAWGSWRLRTAESATVPGVVLRLVQPNISQRLKWDAGEREANFARHLELSAAAPPEGAPPPTHIIWPETAAAFFVEQHAGRRMAMAAVTPPGGLLLTGAPRMSRPDADASWQYWNSLLAIDGSGAVVAHYDKAHLVPFGEYMPLRRWLPVEKIAAGPEDFSPGPGRVTLTLPGLPPFNPLICYEVIFPGAVANSADRPKWLLNLTNDGWYGMSAGPHQHFAIARVRAVEEGLPLVRAANTGISGVVDGYGRVVAQLDLGRAGNLDSSLPQPVPDSTPYGRNGDWILVVMLMSCSLVSFAARHRA